MTCAYDLPGLITSNLLEEVMKDVLKLYVVRFFDSGADSIRTHELFAKVAHKVENTQIYKLEGQLYDKFYIK